jgi:hypothetical protein
LPRWTAITLKMLLFNLPHGAFERAAMLAGDSYPA